MCVYADGSKVCDWIRVVASPERLEPFLLYEKITNHVRDLPEGSYGYSTKIAYKVLDQFRKRLFYESPFNEDWEKDYSDFPNENWYTWNTPWGCREWSAKQDRFGLLFLLLVPFR